MGGSCLGFTGLHFPEDALDYGSQDQHQEDSQQHRSGGEAVFIQQIAHDAGDEHNDHTVHGVAGGISAHNAHAGDDGNHILDRYAEDLDEEGDHQNGHQQCEQDVYKRQVQTGG